MIDEKVLKMLKKIKQALGGPMSKDVKVISIDGVDYVRKGDEASAYVSSGDIKIVVLQRGWVMIGRLERNGSECKLHNASVIRSWGTTKGLGELAMKGPQTNTKLDKCGGLVEFDYLTVVSTITVKQDLWAKEL